MVKNKKSTIDSLRPLSMWEYFGYSILYAIPVIGWIFVIIFSMDESNINRRNYSRSFILVFLLSIIFGIIMTATGASIGLLEFLLNK